MMTLVAELALRDRATEEALAAIDAALETMTRAGDVALLPEFYRLRAVASAALGLDDAAEPMLERARELARRAGLRALALRASTSLAELLARRGEPRAAQQTIEDDLATIRGGEGTRDVMHARALLSALARRVAGAR
jgi:ATP/maltotriose-dependent transcriptional regulator MalT